MGGTTGPLSGPASGVTGGMPESVVLASGSLTGGMPESALTGGVLPPAPLPLRPPVLGVVPAPPPPVPPALGVLGVMAFGSGMRPLQSHALHSRLRRQTRAPVEPAPQLHSVATPGTVHGSPVLHAGSAGVASKSSVAATARVIVRAPAAG
jgi:hypothetical protein